jgi:hypothetical protein
MAWLDSGNDGPCTSRQGSPSNIQSHHPDRHDVFLDSMGGHWVYEQGLRGKHGATLEVHSMTVTFFSDVVPSI